METKLFEIRDRGTHIGVIATKMSATCADEQYELNRQGYEVYGNDNSLVILTDIDTCRSQNSSYNWGDRTFSTAHQYIEENFDELVPGQVIDVRFILHEVDTPCDSDKYFWSKNEEIL